MMICGCKPSKYKEILIEKTIQVLMFRKIVTKLDKLLAVFYKSPTDLNRLQFSIQFGNFRSKYLIDIDIFFALINCSRPADILFAITWFELIWLSPNSIRKTCWVGYCK